MYIKMCSWFGVHEYMPIIGTILFALNALIS